MGAQQSKLTEPSIAEKLAERVRAMQLQHDEELSEGYVYIKEGKSG